MKNRKHVYFLAFTFGLQNARASEHLVDTSYQADKRLVKYQQTNPQLHRPQIRFLQGQTVEFNLTYKKIGQRWLTLDVFHPYQVARNSSKAINLIVMLHGGGWRTGDKTLMYPLANRLAQQGYMVVVPEYRLSIEARYPAAIDDLVAAINWANIRANQTHDEVKTILLGGSSGGHLASFIGLASNDLHRLKDKLTANIDGIVNLDGLLSTVTTEAVKFEDRRKENSALALWLGGSYQQKSELWRQVSPANYLDKDDPDLLVISSGQSRFTAGKELFLQRDKQSPVDFDYIQLNEVEHTFWLFEPYLSDITPPIIRFLNKR
ncbi:MAG: alpha/beta hydrolase [Gammaproteobacteria bacterium]|nr:alpha/beta hydrolase [Gammaproteobacteria bacterium]